MSNISNRVVKTVLSSTAFVLLVSFNFQIQSVNAQEGASGVLEEIVVTARKREESLQDTPVSVSAFTANDLDARQIDNISQISDATPNLTFDATTPISGSNVAASIFIRGIGQTDFTLVTDPGVGLYIDGVYVASSVGGVLDLLDAERVEVLRGPQGTLFGKNTIGGAINITSKRPAEELGGYLEVKTGTDDRLDVKGSVDIPVSDTLGVKLSVADLNQDGYVENLGGGDPLSDTNATVARGVLIWEPTDQFSAMLAVDGTRRRENGRAQKLFDFNPAAPVPSFGPSGAVFASLGQPAFDARFLAGGEFATNQGPNPVVKSDLNLWGASLNLEYDVSDNLTVKSITGYRAFKADFGRDSDNSPVTIVETRDLMNHSQFSQELQLIGTAMDSRLNWILGGYYFEETGSNLNDVDIPLFTIQSGGTIDNETWAIFGQTTYDATDKLALTFGVRYTEDTKGFTPQQVIRHNSQSSIFFVPGTSAVGTPFGLITDGFPIVASTFQDETFDSFDISATIKYQWQDNLMTYFSYSEGFKSGGFDQRIFPPRADLPYSFEPETVTQYEIGAKWENDARNLRANAAIFYSDYEDVHVRVLDAAAPATGNAGTGEVLGAELELYFVPTEQWTITGGLGYLDTELTALGPTIAPDARLAVGNQFVNSPEWAVNASTSYTIPVSSVGELTLRLDWSWKDKVFNNASNDDLIAQDELHLLNASGALTFNHNWEVVAAVRNLTDETYLVTGNYELDSFGYAEGIFAREREWSLSVKYSF